MSSAILVIASALCTAAMAWLFYSTDSALALGGLVYCALLTIFNVVTVARNQ